MAQNIAITTTLAMFLQYVRTAAKMLDQAKFDSLIEPQLVEIIHASIVDVRTLAGASVDRFYRKEVSVTLTISSGLATASVAAYDIASIEHCDLYGTFGSTFRKIPILPNDRYLSLRSYYASSDVGTLNAIARIYLVSGSPDVQTLEVFTGATTITSAKFSFLKNPLKVTLANLTDTMDLPEHLIPTAEDMAAVACYRIAETKPPSDLEQRATGKVSALLSQYNMRLQQSAGAPA
jgi:hypothetical protein